MAFVHQRTHELVKQLPTPLYVVLQCCNFQRILSAYNPRPRALLARPEVRASRLVLREGKQVPKILLT